MTVCIAAVCQNGIIVGASDRQLTSGDIQFEPLRTKIFKLTDSIVALVSGDTRLAHEILRGTLKSLQTDASNADPSLKDVAEIYRAHYQAISLDKAEAKYLAPFGLTVEAFVKSKTEMPGSLVIDLTAKMANFKPSSDGIEVMFIGVDNLGAHIYIVNESDISCHDSDGFAAIGAGYGHAEAQFMFTPHHYRNPIAETLLLVYAAKKRAEVTPGVGRNTDMFIVGPAKGSFTVIDKKAQAKIAEIYDAVAEQGKQLRLKAHEELKKYIDELKPIREGREKREPLGDVQEKKEGE